MFARSCYWHCNERMMISVLADHSRCDFEFDCFWLKMSQTSFLGFSNDDGQDQVWANNLPSDKFSWKLTSWVSTGGLHHRQCQDFQGRKYQFYTELTWSLMKTRKSKRKYQARGNCFKIQFQFQILDEVEINPLDHGNVISSLTQRGQDASQIIGWAKTLTTKTIIKATPFQQWMMGILINNILIWETDLV